MKRREAEAAESAIQDLHPARLLGLCRTRRLARRIVVFDAVDSTNAVTMAAASDGAPEGLLVVAEEQRSGKGRKGRAWLSVKGRSLTFSLLLRPERSEEALTAILALAAVRALSGFVERSGIKWPNDIFLGGKKLGGILAESKEGAVVIGLGLNVNELPVDFPSGIAGEAVSMRIAAGKEFDRAIVLCRLLEVFEELYLRFQREGFVSFKKEIEEKLLYVGENVIIESGGGTFGGTLRGITDAGYIRLAQEGTEKVFSSGDLTLREGSRERD